MNNEFRSSVAITIQSDSKEQGEVEESTIDVRGEWTKKGDYFFLRYREEEKATSTLVKWKPGDEEVWVIRQGEISVRQHFVPAHDLFTVYTTPYGQFVLRTVTHQLHYVIGEVGGEILLHFFTQFDDAEPIEHRMKIQFQVLS